MVGNGISQLIVDVFWGMVVLNARKKRWMLEEKVQIIQPRMERRSNYALIAKMICDNGVLQFENEFASFQTVNVIIFYK